MDGQPKRLDVELTTKCDDGKTEYENYFQKVIKRETSNEFTHIIVIYLQNNSMHSHIYKIKVLLLITNIFFCLKTFCKLVKSLF